MDSNKKFISHFAWITIALVFGIGISHFIFLGGSKVSEIIYEKVLLLTTKNITRASENTEVSAQIPIPVPEKNAETLSIGFVGDIIPNIDAPLNIFNNATPYTQRPDIMIGNFEGVVSKHTYLKCKDNSKNCFAFNGDSNFLRRLADASFDVLNIANNHFNDFGEIGQDETLKEIRAAGMTPIGMKDEIIYIKSRDINVAIIGFSSSYWSSNMNNSEKVKSLISTARQQADIVVAVFHGGGEGEKYTHTPEGIEWYLGENRGDLRTFTHNAIDVGADIVLGSGPHVLRGMELYKDKLIAYSLGNFFYANAFATYGSLKTSAMIEVEFDQQSNIVSGKIIPFEIDKYGTPNPDLNLTAINMINDLSQSDFNQGPILNSSGEIILK